MLVLVLVSGPAPGMLHGAVGPRCHPAPHPLMPLPGPLQAQSLAESKGSALSEEEAFRAQALGWCIEFLQASAAAGCARCTQHCCHIGLQTAAAVSTLRGISPGALPLPVPKVASRLPSC